MTSGLYPMNIKSSDFVSFLTSYKEFTDPALVTKKSEFTTGYTGHQTGNRYVIGQSNPAGAVHTSNICKPRIVHVAELRARSERPLKERKTSRKRSGSVIKH